MSDLFRPERMSKVSVTGAKSVMDEVVETVHDLHVLHVSDYDGSWAGFSPGDPVEGADQVSEKLVTVRSLESILDVDEDDADTARLVTDEAVDSDLEEIRQRVNELDDRRTETEDRLRAVEDAIDAMAPFAALGIDLDLLSGYDSLQVAVGEGDEDAVRGALAADDGVDEFELFTGDGVVAAFARPAADADEDALTDALVGVDFGELEVPDLEDGPVEVEAGDTAPEHYLERLRSRRDQLESKLETVENELEDEKLDAAGFLLAVEEALSIEVQKREAPLSFATTENAFVAEGWIPSDDYDEFEATVTEAVDGHVEVEELERAAYDDRGHAVSREEVEEPPSETDHGAGAGPRAGAEDEDGERESEPEPVSADGGVVTVADDGPPIIQQNPGPSKPFELLVTAVAPPKYDELDPTILLFMTFPAFFGFMIGDVGYGILYCAIGVLLWTRFDDDVMKSMGGITLWAGGFTILFGILYGELFGMHWFGEMIWGPLGFDHPPIEKGLSPAAGDYAQAWLVVSVLVGLFHMTAGFGLDFVRNLGHGLKGAILESASWAMLFVGLWVWIFSTSAASQKPDFLYTALNGEPLPFGFAGFSPEVGMAGIGLAALGLVLAALGEVEHYGPVGAVVTVFDSLEALVHVLSYARIAAVLLAKAGMAFVVNVLVFGAYTTTEVHGGHEVTAYHFAIGESIAEAEAHAGFETWLFEGLIHPELGGLLGVGLAMVLFVLGHLLVLVLGVTSAGLQAIRLEYVEFFTKFYEGGGTAYNPFGRERIFSAED